MKPDWAEENLQTIRTLMERSAVYRRALAPIMIFVGTVGVVGGLTGWLLKIETVCGFVGLWTGVAAFALVGSFMLVRRQALQSSEQFWSPPTRRVGQALLPPFLIGLVVAIVVAVDSDPDNPTAKALLITFWTWFFGCATHAAGFFMSRGVKLFGWIFILLGCGLIASVTFARFQIEQVSSHLLMGGIFGCLHLAYGFYLYFTEKKNPVA